MVGLAGWQLLGEEVSEPLHGMHAGLLDAALRDLSDRRVGNAAARSNSALRDGFGPQVGHHKVVDWR